MLSSRLRWRALAVLGALLSMMIEWQIGLAMPAMAAAAITTTVSPSGTLTTNKTNTACANDSSSHSDLTKNCSASSFSVTSGVNVIDSELSSNPSLSVSSGQQIVSTSSVENLSTSRVHKLSSVHSKRKRKKNVFHITAATLRSLRTYSADPDGDSVHDVTTIDPVIDNSTVYHFLSRTDRSVHRDNQRQRKTKNNLDRNERSANLSHISGPARKIQLYIKNRFIQLMPDGTINGTQDDLSDYTILQRTTVDVGQIKIQGVATCLYLCMDQCGTVYGSKAFTDDCVFNESMEQHHYNTYSSTYNSNSRRTLYLALNRHGEPRKLQIPPTRPLGKLATYTKALTETVPQERVEQLIAKTFGANRVKHGLRQLCDAGRPLVELTAKVMKARPKCNMTANGQAAVSEKVRISSSSTNSSNSQNSSSSISHSHGSNLKKKKKKRRCRPDETEGENCHKGGPQALKKRPQKSKCSTDEECANRRKSSNKKQHQHQHQQSKQNGGNKKGKKQNGQHGKKGKNGGGGGGKTTTTPRSIQTTSTISSAVPTTTYPTLMTSTEQQGNDDEIDDITGTSGENDEDEDISSMTSIGSQTNLVDSGEDLFYDGEFDVKMLRNMRLRSSK